MAMPDKDMMFEATPNCRMRMERGEHGQRQGEAKFPTMRLRRCMRMRRMATEAMSIPAAEGSARSVWTAPFSDDPRVVVEGDDPHALRQARL